MKDCSDVEAKEFGLTDPLDLGLDQQACWS